MSARTLIVSAGIGLAAMACNDARQPIDEAAEATQAIVRPTALGGRDQAVMLYSKKLVNGMVYNSWCSGTYFAPRVVVTAAHCLKDIYFDQLFVYWGDNFEVDVAQLGAGYWLQAPPVGQPSFWSKADSWETHPAWDPALKHPDLGVVYLDRKPPFDPLPLARFRLDNTWINKNVTITGWGGDVATSPTTATGGRVQRTGTTKFLGSPTAADYHPDDPNPGMLDPVVRQNVAKIDGTAPNSNSCFGDSGGPMLVNRWGQDYVAGVSYFGGFWCEEYGLYTRIDPFLPFFDEAYKKGGQAELKPHLECVHRNVDGVYTAYYGYENKNGVSITIPYGSKNYFPKDASSRRPTKFLPGHAHFAFGVDFTASETLVYRLSPDNNPTTELRTNAQSTKCAGANLEYAEIGDYCRSIQRSGCPGIVDFANCVSEVVGIAQTVPACAAELHALNGCYAATPAGAENWYCDEGGYPYPFALACGELEATYWSCLADNW